MNTKVRPNDLCPCGSGKKYKKCCFKKVSRAPKAPLFRRRNKAVKTQQEIEGMRTACRFNAQLMNYIRPLVKAGMSTEEINTLVQEYTIDHGHIPAPLNYYGFPKSVCTSVNDVVCHGIPTEKQILKEGDIINVDVTTIVDGYHGDQSETILIGDVSEQARKVANVSKTSLDIGIDTVKAGIPLGEVCGAVEDYVHSQGCSVVRDFTGHGIGKKFHEDPQVPHYRTPAANRFMLESGMTFTIEPMVNIGDYRIKVLDDDWTAVTRDGSLSAQYEHTILVTDEGCEVLTDTRLV